MQRATTLKTLKDMGHFGFWAHLDMSWSKTSKIVERLQHFKMQILPHHILLRITLISQHKEAFLDLYSNCIWKEWAIFYRTRETFCQISLSFLAKYLIPQFAFLDREKKIWVTQIQTLFSWWKWRLKKRRSKGNFTMVTLIVGHYLEGTMSSIFVHYFAFEVLVWDESCTILACCHDSLSQDMRDLNAKSSPETHTFPGACQTCQRLKK